MKVEPVQEFTPVGKPEDVAEYGPGEAPAQWQHGDLLVTHGDAWTSVLIRIGQALRIHGDDRKYTYWNHVAIVADDRGSLIEAIGRGVTRRPASVYQPKEYQVIDVKASVEDRAQVVLFARWAAGEVAPDGTPTPGGKHVRYGFLTIVSIAISLLTGLKFAFGISGEEICSSLAARAMERTGAIFTRASTHIMPADVAKYYGAVPPTS